MSLAGVPAPPLVTLGVVTDARTALRLRLQVPWGADAHGDDSWLAEHLLRHKQRGFFVEVGAGAGGDSSVSRWFERAAGWRGLLVEGDAGERRAERGVGCGCAARGRHPTPPPPSPSPHPAAVFDQLSANRPGAICLHAVVCGSQFGTVHWASSGGGGGAGGQAPRGGAAIFELLPEAARRGVSLEQLPAVSCTPLQYILDKCAAWAGGGSSGERQCRAAPRTRPHRRAWALHASPALGA